MTSSGTAWPPKRRSGAPRAGEKTRGRCKELNMKCE